MYLIYIAPEPSSFVMWFNISSKRRELVWFNEANLKAQLQWHNNKATSLRNMHIKNNFSINNAMYTNAPIFPIAGCSVSCKENQAWRATTFSLLDTKGKLWQFPFSTTNLHEKSAWYHYQFSTLCHCIFPHHNVCHCCYYDIRSWVKQEKKRLDRKNWRDLNECTSNLKSSDGLKYSWHQNTAKATSCKNDVNWMKLKIWVKRTF